MEAELAKALVGALALVISIVSLVLARLADIRSRKAEVIRNLLGEKETVAFGALKLLRDGLPPKRSDRDLVIDAVMQACVFESSDRARALLYRAIELNREQHEPEFLDAFHRVEKSFKAMDVYGFSVAELDLKNGHTRLGAVGKVLGGRAKSR
ncbi:hypothetical protein [Streptomyces sp. NPDC057280]|uniref:hypothetical protein n=1 Tax=Streptomyces sp. NPDC057280 TaxID=3346081 RepID=UPI003626C7EF